MNKSSKNWLKHEEIGLQVNVNTCILTKHCGRLSGFHNTVCFLRYITDLIQFTDHYIS